MRELRKAAKENHPVELGSIEEIKVSLNLFKVHKFQESLAAANLTLDSNPNLAEMRLLRAVLRIILQEFDSALEDLNSLLERKDNWRECWFFRSIANYNLGFLEQSGRDWQQY